MKPWTLIAIIGLVATFLAAACQNAPSATPTPDPVLEEARRIRETSESLMSETLRKTPTPWQAPAATPPAQPTATAKAPTPTPALASTSAILSRGAVIEAVVLALEPVGSNVKARDTWGHLQAERYFWEADYKGFGRWRVFMPAWVRGPGRSGDTIDLLGSDSEWEFDENTRRLVPVNVFAKVLWKVLKGQ